MKYEAAFPCHEILPDGMANLTPQRGMTLRDYFAAHSIQTAMSMVKHDFETEGNIFCWNKNEREIAVGRAYQIADAMLVAREEE